jgi:hypothetical protein
VTYSRWLSRVLSRLRLRAMLTHSVCYMNAPSSPAVFLCCPHRRYDELYLFLDRVSSILFTSRFFFYFFIFSSFLIFIVFLRLSSLIVFPFLLFLFSSIFCFYFSFCIFPFHLDLFYFLPFKFSSLSFTSFYRPLPIMCN